MPRRTNNATNSPQTPTGVGISELLDAAELCECLVAKLTLTAADTGKTQVERMKANTERIALWEAATIMRREASNDKLTDSRRG